MAAREDAPSPHGKAGECPSMKPFINGLVIAVVHVGLVASLGAKLLYDRATRSRVWALAAPYDPSLPIRGRYVRLGLVVEPRGIQETKPGLQRPLPQPVDLRVENGRLIAEANPQDGAYSPADLHIRTSERRIAYRVTIDQL